MIVYYYLLKNKNTYWELETQDSTTKWLTIYVNCINYTE